MIWKRAELICQFSVLASQRNYRKDLVCSSLGTWIELPRQEDWNGQAKLAGPGAGRPSLIILGLVIRRTLVGDADSLLVRVPGTDLHMYGGALWALKALKRW